jgi:hypothetical protein
MAHRDALLIDSLRSLVRQWGHKEVKAALADVCGTAGWDDASQSPNIGDERTKRLRSATKLLASEQVARAQLPEVQEVILLKLAVRFDRREFLPSISDVRQFLIMMGETPGAMKDRSEAFRRLLKLLSRLPLERLEQLMSSSLYSGPSQLGPLSDAISTVAASRPCRNKINES